VDVELEAERGAALVCPIQHGVVVNSENPGGVCEVVITLTVLAEVGSKVALHAQRERHSETDFKADVGASENAWRDQADGFFE
jgi:hypothetical protein